jgi:hypothetical protein
MAEAPERVIRVAAPRLVPRRANESRDQNEDRFRAELERRLGEIEQRLNAAEAERVVLGDRIETGFVEFGALVQALDDRLSAVEAMVDDHETRLAALEGA